MGSKITKLAALNLDENAIATLTYEDGADVFHFNESEIDTALSETDVVEQLAELIATPKLRALDTYTGALILDSLRAEDMLDDYDRGDECFAEYLTDTINNNFYDLDLIDSSTTKYDHKRGFTTLTARVSVPVKSLIETNPFLGSWNVEVTTPDGTLLLD